MAADGRKSFSDFMTVAYEMAKAASARAAECATTRDAASGLAQVLLGVAQELPGEAARMRVLSEAASHITTFLDEHEQRWREEHATWQRIAAALRTTLDEDPNLPAPSWTGDSRSEDDE